MEFNEKLEQVNQMQEELKQKVNELPSSEEVKKLIKNGGDPDEMCTDISNITQNVTRLVKEFKTFKQDTMAFNEA